MCEVASCCPLLASCMASSTSPGGEATSCKMACRAREGEEAGTTRGGQGRRGESWRVKVAARRASSSSEEWEGVSRRKGAVLLVMKETQDVVSGGGEGGSRRQEALREGNTREEGVVVEVGRILKCWESRGRMGWPCSGGFINHLVVFFLVIDRTPFQSLFVAGLPI